MPSKIQIKNETQNEIENEIQNEMKNEIEKRQDRLRVIKGTHCNLPRPESPNPKKYVSLFVQKTTKSEPFA